MPTIDLTCTNCEEEFRAYMSPSAIEKTQNFFCSRECVNEFQKKSQKGMKNPNYKHGRREKIEQICENCGQTFFSFRERKFCSQGCAATGENNAMWKGGKETVECVVCNKEIERYPSEIGERIYCSRNCMKRAFSIEEDKEKRIERFYSSQYWKDLRKAVKEIFGNKCLKCGVKKNIHVHHIIPLRKGIRTSPHWMHFMTLCDKHHAGIRGKDIEEQFEYLGGLEG